MILSHDGKANSKLLILVVAAVCGVLIAYFVQKSAPSDPENNPAGLYSQSREIKINLVLQNSTSRLLNNTETRIFLPYRQNAHQYSEFVSANQEVKIFQDNIGNQHAYFQLKKVEPGQSIPIIIDFKLYQSESPVKTDEPDTVQYLYVDNVDHESLNKLNELAKQFKAEGPNETVNNVLQWWRTNQNNLAALDVSGSQTEGSAAQNTDEVSGELANEEPISPIVDEALEVEPEANPIVENEEQISDAPIEQQEDETFPDTKEPIATTFYDSLIGKFKSPYSDASLVTALLRSVKIPARTVIGVNTKGKTAVTTQDLVYWIEFFDGSVWKDIDLLNSQMMQDPNAYLAIQMYRELPTEFTDESDIDFLYESAGLSIAPGSLRILFN